MRDRGRPAPPHMALTILGVWLALGHMPLSMAAPVPAALTALLSAQRITKPVAAWCQGEFRPGQAAAFAVAFPSAVGGVYTVIEAGTPIVELGNYARQPSLDCYSQPAALELDGTIQRSQTIHGRVAPR